MLKTIGFVNPNFQQGPKEFNAYYLPYSIGVLWNYANQNPKVRDNYQIGSIIWRRDPIAEVVQRFKDYDVVAFSTYIWNKSYCYELAKQIKAVNPTCLILFGGPEPAIEDPEIFVKHPYMDAVACFEGEITFTETLIALLESTPLVDVPGLIVNVNQAVVKTAKRDRIDNINDIPSPHLTGFFDEIMAANPDVEWNAVIESNRGCPYQCTFCDWGSLTYNKVKKFDLQRVLDELEWIGKNKIGFITIADANFGIFPERDNLIADKLIEIQKKYGYPNAYTISWAKNQKSDVLAIVKKLVNNGSRGGLTVSVQSLDDGVLKIIKRNNMAINQIEDIFAECDRDNIPVVTELILGLPGETARSWRENYYKLFRANNHTGISTYNAQLLENAELNLTQRKFYKIETVLVRDYMCGTDEEVGIEESVEVVKSTRDMPYDKLLESIMFTWFINTFHINGLSNILSRFAYKYSGVDYKDFYDSLFEFLLTTDWFANEYKLTHGYYDEWFTTGRVDHPKLGATAIYGMNLGQRTSISIHTEVRYREVFDILKAFVKFKFNDYQAGLVDDLLTVQENYYVKHPELLNYPKHVTLPHNIMGYIQTDEPLNATTAMTFEFPEDKHMTLLRFCENSWFGRRRNFGKAIVNYEVVNA